MMSDDDPRAGLGKLVEDLASTGRDGWILLDGDEATAIVAEIGRLEAEVERLRAERADIGSDHHDAISKIRLENYTLRAEVAERDAWSAEAAMVLRERNVLLDWACQRFGFACGHDVMVAAGLDGTPAGEEGDES